MNLKLRKICLLFFILLHYNTKFDKIKGVSCNFLKKFINLEKILNGGGIFQQKTQDLENLSFCDYYNE